MTPSHVAISNLLYLYAEKMDAGDFEGAAELFCHAWVHVQGGHTLDAAGLLTLWRKHVVVYPCGTPRTRHVVTNPIIEIDEAVGRATARSYYTVLQATDGLPLQPIAAGRYHDTFEQVFEREDATWRFSARDYSLLDMTGDMSWHLRDYPGL